MKRKMLLLLVCLFPLFLSAQKEKDSVVDSVVLRGDLRIGEDLNLGDAAVSFLKVISDSRCPRQVTCIWQGEAKVLLGINYQGQYFKKVVVISGSENFLPGFENLKLNFSQLSPYPETGRPIAHEDYFIRYSASVAIED